MLPWITIVWVRAPHAGDGGRSMTILLMLVAAPQIDLEPLREGAGLATCPLCPI